WLLGAEAAKTRPDCALRVTLEQTVHGEHRSANTDARSDAEVSAGDGQIPQRFVRHRLLECAQVLQAGLTCFLEQRLCLILAESAGTRLQYGYRRRIDVERRAGRQRGDVGFQRFVTRAIEADDREQLARIGDGRIRRAIRWRERGVRIVLGAV